MVASTVAQQRSRDLLGRLRRQQRGPRGSMLVFSVPDSHGGILILERSSPEDRLTVTGGHLRRGIWTRQLEAVQRIAAGLTRLASVGEVAWAVCGETRRVIDYDEAHVLIRREGAELEPAGVVGAPVGPDGRPLGLSDLTASSRSTTGTATPRATGC